MRDRILVSALGFALLPFLSAVAVAAEPDADSTAGGLEEITVTATRRAEPAEHVPVSINVFSSRMLTEANLKSVSDLATVSPGFQYAEPQANPSTILTLAIRGMNTSTGEAVVGVYYDETPMQTRLSSPTNFTSLLPVVFDLNRVEILNGPQGTLFGAGAEAGAVRFIPNGPNMTESSGYTHAEVGRNERGGNGSVRSAGRRESHACKRDLPLISQRDRASFDELANHSVRDTPSPAGISPRATEITRFGGPRELPARA